MTISFVKRTNLSSCISIKQSEAKGKLSKNALHSWKVEMSKASMTRIHQKLVPSGDVLICVSSSNIRFACGLMFGALVPPKVTHPIGR
jgi:hypothetical protein